MSILDMSQCLCECHVPDRHIKHVVACCDTCPHCKLRIKAWSYKEHVEACGELRKFVLKRIRDLEAAMAMLNREYHAPTCASDVLGLVASCCKPPNARIRDLELSNERYNIEREHYRERCTKLEAANAALKDAAADCGIKGQYCSNGCAMLYTRMLKAESRMLKAESQVAALTAALALSAKEGS